MTRSSNPARTCKHCGGPIRSDGAGEVCDACLIQEGLVSGDSQLEESVDTALPGDADSGLVSQGGGPAMPDKLEGGTVGPGGRYRILQRIGEGGFGMVYMAEQTEPVRRRVALKILKAGMDTRQVVARFEAERQALAMMDHPNIAKILDGGETDQGRPFFVMELVRGTPITKYCDREQLDTGARLGLFLQVCQAVQHAHQKGIIHRDLKPSNILITAPDGAEPVPKVIDFGVAKALENNLTDKTLFTRFEQMIGTPAYMSPEQAGSEGGIDVDTRADIYALGVLLYELLSGSTPIETSTLQNAAFEEVRRILREEDAPRPSARLSSLAADRRSTIATARGTGASGLNKLLRGDLDWIVMKAIEKDRRRRYDTANALAEDVARHLADEPVSAGPPTAAYRTGKFLRRHKAPLAVAATIGLVLVAGIVATGWQAIRATEEKNRALEAEALAEERQNEAEAISEFVTGMFETASPGADEGGRLLTVAKSLKIAERKLDENKVISAGQKARLRESIADVYWDLGFFGNAIAVQERVRDYYLSDPFGDRESTIRSLSTLASYYRNNRKLDAAHGLSEEALSLSRELLGEDHPETISAMRGWASSLKSAGREDEARALLEDALVRSRTVNGPEDESTLPIMFELYRYYQGEEGLEKSIELTRLCERIMGLQNPTTLSAMERVAERLLSIGRREEGITKWEELLALRRIVLGPEHPDTLMAMNNLAYRYHFGANRNEEALTMAEELLPLCQKSLGPEHVDTLTVMNNLAVFYHEVGRVEEALLMREKVLPLRRKALGPNHPETVSSMHALAFSLDHVGRFKEALAMCEKVLSLRREILGREHPDTLAALNNLGNSYHDNERNEDALKVRLEQLEVSRELHGEEHFQTRAAKLLLADAYQRLGQFDEVAKLRGPGHLPVKPDSPSPAAVLVPPTSVWRWLHPVDGVDPAEAGPDFHRIFHRPDFDDSEWSEGTDGQGEYGGFGYGDEWFTGVDIGTPAEKGLSKAAYFRHSFTTDKLFSNLELRCQRDDGIVIYLDGEEVARGNMDQGEESFELTAESSVGDSAETTIFRLPLQGVTLAPGEHLLAISVHNTENPSSDLRIGEISLVEVEAEESDAAEKSAGESTAVAEP